MEVSLIKRFINFLLNILIISLIVGCYGINEKTSEIGDLNTDCLDKHAWEELLQKYNTENIEDTIFIEALKDLKLRTFQTEVFYFRDTYPKELIAVSEDHYSVRYVFNPSISNRVLNGLSTELSEKEKKRIRNRIQLLLMDYQCKEGIKKSKELLNE